MIRLFLVTLCLTVLLAVCAILAGQVGQGARPGLAAQILLDRSCPQPCWRAIRPGHTTVEQARTLLIAGGPFIQHVTNGPASEVPGQPRVCWSMDAHPDWTGCAERDVVSDGPVYRIELHIPPEANFTLGDAIVLFGKPQAAMICPQYGFQLAAIYFADNVEVMTRLNVPSDKRAFNPFMPVFAAYFDEARLEPAYRFDIPAWRGFVSWHSPVEC